MIFGGEWRIALEIVWRILAVGITIDGAIR